jgi:regulator of replication initiation timing
VTADDLKQIESKLKFSKRIDGLIKGHQQEMQQVLEDKEDLQSAVELLLNKVSVLEKQLAAEQEKNSQLQAENQELRNRPNIVTDTYIETQNVKQQCNYLPHPRRVSRYKLSTTNQTQLQLWNQPTVSSM